VSSYIDNHYGLGSEGVRSVEGRDPGRPRRDGLGGDPLASAREEPRAVGNLAGDRRREEYVYALFRDLEENPAALLLRRRVGHILLGTGLALIVVGFLAMVGVKAPELLLSLALGINVLAVLCVAAGILLLPEGPTPNPAGPGAARGLGRFPPRRVRLRLPFPHLPIRHTRH
jgi:hypothetical protein